MSEPIEDRILRYPTLSAEEQREVEVRAAERPEWQALLREAQALEEQISEARLFTKMPPSDEALAHYLVAKRLGTHPLPEATRRAFERVEAHLNEHPEERARLRTFEERLDELEANSTDPAKQFEELSGFSLEGEQEASAPGRERAGDRAPRAREPARIYHIAARWSRRAAVAALLLVGLYGVLFLASSASQSPTERLAAFTDEELSVEGYRMRGSGSATSADSSSADARYLRALAALREARTTTVGLFPRYDESRLRRAERQLQQVISQTEQGDFLHLEALYFLGKTQLALGQTETARASLSRVIEGQGRKAEAARRILRELR